jgi:hypothetical protein
MPGVVGTHSAIIKMHAMGDIHGIRSKHVINSGIAKYETHEPQCSSESLL